MNNTSSIFLIVLSLAVFYTFTMPEYAEVSILRDSAKEYRDLLNNASDIASMRDRLLGDYRAFPQGEVDSLSKVLPDSADAVTLALDLDATANRYGALVKAVDQANPAGPGVIDTSNNPYSKATVSVTFTASYGGFANFLKDVERSLRVMDVRSLSFQVNEAGFYDHRMTIDTYWLK